MPLVVEKCVGMFKEAQGEGADVMDEVFFSKLLSKLGIESALVPKIYAHVRSADGTVSWRKFVEWAATAGSEPLGLRLMASRRSAAGFDSSKPVSHAVVKSILETSLCLPSSANTQPWTMLVVQGAVRDKLSEQMLQRFDAGDAGQLAYQDLPEAMTERMKKAAGLDQEPKGRAECEFFGAPVHVLLCAPQSQSLEEKVDGIFLDIGTCMTSILMGAHSLGLASTPQLTTAKYHTVCREVLGDSLPEDLLVVCGVSLGHASGENPTAADSLLPVSEFSRWTSCDADWVSAGVGPAGSGGRTLIELMKSRHCSHKLDTARVVPKDVIEAVLSAARNVPSYNNSQPWSVTVIQGKMRDELSRVMLEKFDGGKDGGQTYKKYSANNTARMQKGKDMYGFELYEQLHGLDRDDKVGRRLKYRPNYEFWGGPVLLLLKVPTNAVGGTFVDIGSYMYAILVAMHTYGLGGKPLGSVAKYTDICREVLGAAEMPEDEHLVCGLCIGYPMDGRDPRETPDFFPSRLPLEETTSWVVDPDWAAA